MFMTTPRYLLGIAIIVAVLLPGCSNGDQALQANPGVSNPAHTFAGSAPLGTSRVSAAAYFIDTFAPSVTEYARTATRASAPLRQITTKGTFIGADKLGEIFSFTSSGEDCKTPCRVFVADERGNQQRVINLASMVGGTKNPGGFFVDRNGSLYYLQGCSTIVQLPPGAAGTNPKPTRTINIPRQDGCALSQSYVRLFATPGGSVFLSGFYSGKNAWYIWPPGASGNAKHRTVVNVQAVYAIEGVDSHGNAYLPGHDPSTAPSAAWFGPTANGRVVLNQFSLKGVSYVDHLRISSKDQFVYQGPDPNSPADEIIRVAPAGGGKPTRTLPVGPTSSSVFLQSITF
jgi:hypothetical protein